MGIADLLVLPPFAPDWAPWMAPGPVHPLVVLGLLVALVVVLRLWECGSALTGVACGSLPPGSSWSPCCNKTKPPYVLFMCFLFSGSKEKNPPFSS